MITSIVQSGGVVTVSGQYNDQVLLGTTYHVDLYRLAPGFTYTLSATGGALNLVALNDGVPTTQAARRVYLPLITR